MNKNEILLNMHHDTIVFSNQLNSFVLILLILNSFKHSSKLRLILTSFTHTFKILKCSTSTSQKDICFILNINAVSFQTLID